MGTALKKKYEFDIDDLSISVLGVARFYASILSKMHKVPTVSIPTAGVGFNKAGKICLYYNEEFLFNLPFDQAQAVLIHEVLHVFWRHVIGRLKEVDKDNKELQMLKNCAYDIAINQYIPNLPPMALYPEKFGFEKDLTSEIYYELLKEMKDKNGKGKGEGEGGGDGEDDGEGDGNQTIDSHDLWDKVVEKGDKAGKENVKSVKAYDIDPDFEAQSVVEKSIKECRDDYGNIPAAIKKAIDEIKTPIKREDWKTQMRIFVNSVLASARKLSQKKVNRRLADHEFIFPGKKKTKRPQLMVFLDSSGTCYDDEFQVEFKNELLQISKFAQVFFAYVDTKVGTIHKVRTMADMDQEVEGGGGTCFIEAFEIARKRNVDGVIYMTDTYGSFPNVADVGKLAQRTIWMTLNQPQVNIPFGLHLNINTNN